MSCGGQGGGGGGVGVEVYEESGTGWDEKDGCRVIIMIIIMAFIGAIQDFFTISSQRRELSPTCTLKWPGRNRVQITWNTSSAYHVQVSCYVPLGMKGELSY